MRTTIKKTSVPITMLLILLSVAVQGAYAADNSTMPEAPHMDLAEMKNMSLEMMEMNIESLDTMRSSGDYEELDDSISSLLEQMEVLRSEIENAQDEEELSGIMEDHRTLIENAPEGIREKLMENRGTGEPGNGNLSRDNNTMRGPEGQGSSPGGNDSMREGNFSSEKPGEGRTVNGAANEGNNGLLSGLINMIRSILI